ncbi:MAG: glutamate synthase subunit beta [Ardenticatenaceae bacterium]|nr:glutamate synthase subunit beta [Ardenticatenaceae bacterium]
MSNEKATGFLTFNRQNLPERPPQERIKDWKEMYIPLPMAELQQQGQRCMDCGIPFCHTGETLNNMTSGCPLNNLIPEWNDLIYRGLWKEAYERLDKTNNFPEFTGRVCPAPCESACVLGINADPVTIKSIENAIIDRAFEEGWVQPFVPKKQTGNKVAVIGSGPAGLACADQLNKVGHKVTVFERAPRPGGLMTYGIPNMKIEKETVFRRIRLMEESGIEFLCNTNVGVDIEVETLQRDFDAVVLCGGATNANNLPLPGRDLGGIYFAVDYLSQTTESLIQSNLANNNYLSAKGKDVIVIGGGDTGTDCVGTAVRHGCRSVTQFEIVEQPASERPADNPWPEWPRILKLDYGQKEAKALYGEDPRQFSILTTEFVGDENGQLAAIKTVDVVWRDDPHGGHRFDKIPGSEREWPAQLVLLAIGFRGPENPLLDALNVERDARSNAKAEFDEYVTNIDGVFTAGDMRRGQSLVVWAIREGRGAAREVDRYLMGETDLP